MGIFNLFKSKKKSNEIGNSITWRDSINLVFKIIDFDSNGTIIDMNGKVKAKSLYKPYGYLTVSNPYISENHLLPIVHKDDYFLIEQYFTDPRFKEVIQENEILVVYRPKNIVSSGAAGFDHCLHYVITPKDTIAGFYKKYGHSPSEEIIENLFVTFSWGTVQVEVNESPLN